MSNEKHNTSLKIFFRSTVVYILFYLIYHDFQDISI